MSADDLYRTAGFDELPEDRLDLDDDEAREADQADAANDVEWLSR